MITLIDRAMNRVKLLPVERQDDLGEIILSLVEQDESEFQLDADQEREIRRRLANPEPAVSSEAAQHFFQRLI